MKNSRTCPKCGGHDILRVPGKSGAYGTGNNIQTGFSIFSAVRLRLLGGMDRPVRP